VSTPFPSRVRIVEVGPRDGLQNEAAAIATADKIGFVDRLSDAGHALIEVSAFVSPTWVPQMADAAAVFAAIRRREGTRYTALVPNLPGLERAVAAQVDAIAIFAAASETFSRRNINQTIAESLATYAGVAARAQQLGLPVRAYVSTAFGCPFEGDVPPAAVADVAAALVDMGAYEVAVSDTIGTAHPAQVPRVLDAVTQAVPLDRVALQHGVGTFDASAGGLGGCPYAPGATGNLATEDLLYMLNGYGIETGVSLDRVLEASRFIEPRLGHPLSSRYLAAVRRIPHP